MRKLPGRVAVVTAVLVLPAAGALAQPPSQPPPNRSAGGSASAYYGQSLPGETPQPFGAEVTGALGLAKAPVFSADGREMFWARGSGKYRAMLLTSRLESAKWTAGAPLSFSTGEFFDHNPALSRDGRRLVFASNRPIPGKPPTTLPGSDVPTSDLWVVERTAAGWSAPAPLGPAFNTTSDEDCPVLAADDTLYFSSSRPGPTQSPGAIFRASAAGGSFADPERLPAPVSDAGEMVSGVAPDQAYLLFYSMKSGEGGGLRVSFRGSDGSWRPSVALAPAIGGLRAYAASVTLDGRWILLTAPGGGGPAIYWVSATVVDRLRALK